MRATLPRIHHDRGRGDRQAVAELGFVVVTIDGAASPYMMRRRYDFFVKWLLGTEPPKEYDFGR